jgi:hypothetical protein
MDTTVLGCIGIVAAGSSEVMELGTKLKPRSRARQMLLAPIMGT